MIYETLIWINFITTSLFSRLLGMVNKGNHPLLWPCIIQISDYADMMYTRDSSWWWSGGSLWHCVYRMSLVWNGTKLFIIMELIINIGGNPQKYVLKCVFFFFYQPLWLHGWDSAWQTGTCGKPPWQDSYRLNFIHALGGVSWWLKPQFLQFAQCSLVYPVPPKSGVSFF